MKNGKQKIIMAIISLVAAFLVQGSAQAFTWHVDQNDADCNDVVGMPFCSIQPAFDAASDGDTIVIAPGTYTENLSVTDKGFLLEGAGSAETIIDGSGGGGIAVKFDSSGPSYTIGISDLTIQNGTDGGVYVVKGTVEITDSIITSNDAVLHAGGGVAVLSGALTVTGSEITENSAPNCGGVYVVAGAVEITDSKVDENTATATGGGLCQTSGDLTIENSSVSGNTGGSTVGGVYAIVTNFVLTDSFVNDNEAVISNVGGILIAAATATIDHSSISENTTGAAVGGMYQMTGDLTVTDSVIDGNLSVGNVAGIAHDNGTFILSRSTVSNNGTRGSGGGVYVAGSSNFYGINSTISGNWAFLDAAGLLNGGTSWMGNMTVTDNTSDYDGNGTGDGAGLYRSSGAVTVENSIIAGNVDLTGVAPDCFGNITSAGFNILGDNTGCTFTALASDQVGTLADPIDPLLGDLLENGGDTETHELLAGSSAIDAGDPAGCDDGFGTPLTVDQRGFDRPVGSNCDIGAFEVGDCGDGFLDEDEECDDGNSAEGDGCNSLCQVEVCGNGVVDSGEACDDANTMDGDGCDSVCQVEVTVVGPEEVAETPDLSDLSDETDDADELTEDAATGSGGCSLAVQSSPFAVSGYGLLTLFGFGLAGLLYKRALV